MTVNVRLPSPFGQANARLDNDDLPLWGKSQHAPQGRSSLSTWVQWNVAWEHPLMLMRHAHFNEQRAMAGAEVVSTRG